MAANDAAADAVPMNRRRVSSLSEIPPEGFLFSEAALVCLTKSFIYFTSPYLTHRSGETLSMAAVGGPTLMLKGAQRFAPDEGGSA